MASNERVALIVANGDPPTQQILDSLLVDDPFVVAADGGANWLLQLGIIPSVVVGDFDSLSEKLPSSVLRITHPDQNFTDLDKAVSYLRKDGFIKILITGATGDRLDHTFGSLSVLAKHGLAIDLSLIDSIGTARLIGKSAQFRTKVGQIVSLLPLGRVSGIVTAGLQWDLYYETLEPGVRDGTSNVAISEEVSITVGSGELIAYIHHG